MNVLESSRLRFKKGSLLSFEGCPNNCYDGWYNDLYSHKKVRCEWCAEKRKQLVTTYNYTSINEDGIPEDIDSILRLPPSFQGIDFDRDTLYPKSSLKYLDSDSLAKVTDLMSAIVTKLTGGIPLEKSYVLPLSDRSKPSGFISACYKRAYIGGLTIAPYVDLHSLRLSREEIQKDSYTGFEIPSYSTFVNADFVLFEAYNGVTYAEGNTLLDLIRARARGNKATLILTGNFSSPDEISKLLGSMCTYVEEEADYETPYLLRVELVTATKKEEPKGNKILSGMGLNGFVGV